MFSEVDRNSARLRNHKKFNKGKSLDSNIAEWKAPYGGKVFSAGKVRLGLGILAKVKQSKQAIKKKEREAKEKDFFEHENLVREAELIKEDMRQVNKAPKDLRISQLRPLLRALKCAGDKAIPTIKANMVKCYEQWSERPYLINPNRYPLMLEVVAGAAVEEEENGSTSNAQEGDDGNRSDEEEDNDDNEMFLDQEF